MAAISSLRQYLLQQQQARAAGNLHALAAAARQVARHTHTHPLARPYPSLQAMKADSEHYPFHQVPRSDANVARWAALRLQPWAASSPGSLQPWQPPCMRLAAAPGWT